MSDSFKNAREEIENGERFAFGQNWQKFLDTLTEEKIEQACFTLSEMLDRESLTGMRFLDVGSGSGLFSLAARRLGATVYSFDFDPQSVACTTELRRRFFANDPQWVIEQGSVLDREFLATLDQHDIVYSWGVLHHTGDMWQALENVLSLVCANGTLFIAIYNDEGSISQRWKWVKSTYNSTPAMRPLLLTYGWCRAWGKTLLRDTLQLRPLYTWRTYAAERGMSPWIDVVDWVGGWPFEVATPDEIFLFYRKRGFSLQNLTTRQGRGCNEFVFSKTK